MPWPTVGLLAGSAFASGLNLYATIATLGLLDRLGAADLPPELAILAHPAVLAVAATLYVIEFFADKIPWVDSVWDAVHTFIRPPAAAVLAYAATARIPEEWRVVAALLAGGIALTSHGVKATTRAAVNTSPEPFSNWGLSFTEDLVAIFLAWLAATHPLLTVGIVVVLVVIALFVIVKFFGFLRRAFHPRRQQSGPAPSPRLRP